MTPEDVILFDKCKKTFKGSKADINARKAMEMDIHNIMWHQDPMIEHLKDCGLTDRQIEDYFKIH